MLRKKGAFSVVVLIVPIVHLLLQINAVVSQPVGTYYPTGYNLLGATAYVSGEPIDLQSDNSVYMTFRSYASQTSAQTLYVHQEATTIAGTSYYLLKTEGAEASGTSLSASLSSAGRQLWGKTVYPLTGVKFIPAGSWTDYYRAWHSSVPETVSTNSPSSSPLGTWSNPTEAYVSDDTYADSDVSNAFQQYGNYGFSISPSANIVKVEVGYEAYTDTDEKIGVSVSWNNGVNWATEYVSSSLGATDPNMVTWIDFTTATSWTAEKLSNANFLTRARAIQTGVLMDGVYLDWIPVKVTYAISPSAHADIDILIRQSNGTIRQSIATNTANSGTLSTTAQTLSGTYAWSAYTVVDESDYLEIDYYVDVTIPVSGVTAYLRIDDGALSTADQTRTTGVVLPSEYTMEVEFTGISDTNYWSQLVWAVDSAWTTANVAVTLQLYNYTLGSYPSTGNGYMSYMSTATPNTDETKSQTIITNPTHFRDSLGNWKIRAKGVKSTSTQFDFKADLIKLEVTGDVNRPIWSNQGTNSTAPGQPTTFYVKWTDNVGLSGFIFGTNNTGTWKNDTWTPLSGNINWSNVTKILNTTAGIIVQWRVWANDTSNNWNETGVLSLKTLQGPVASFTYLPSTPFLGQTITFDASASNDPDGNIISYKWNFGDGNITTVTNSIITHAYSNNGTYTVTLNVTDNNGYFDTASSIVTVHIRDVAIISIAPAATEIYVGQVINVAVVVKNEGTVSETFNVTLYYNETIIGTKAVSGLAPNAKTTLIFGWNTTGLTYDANYVIKAEIPSIPGETDINDNAHTYGTVKVRGQTISRPFDWPPIFSYVIPLSLGVLGLLIAGAVWKRHRAGSKEVGFEYFNEMTNGGVPDSYSVMIIGEANSGKSTLCQQLAYTCLTQAKACVYISYDCFPDEIRKNIKGFNWDTSTYEQEGTFKFIDAYSSIANAASQEKLKLEDPFSLSDLGIAISVALEDMKEKSVNVFLDSTASLFTHIEPAEVIKFLEDRSARIKGNNGVFFFTVGKGTVPPDLMRRLEEIVDSIIELEVYKEKGSTVRKMCIRKMRGRRFHDTCTSFNIKSPNGIRFSFQKGQSKNKLRQNPSR